MFDGPSSPGQLLPEQCILHAKLLTLSPLTVSEAGEQHHRMPQFAVLYSTDQQLSRHTTLFHRIPPLVRSSLGARQGWCLSFVPWTILTVPAGHSIIRQNICSPFALLPNVSELLPFMRTHIPSTAFLWGASSGYFLNYPRCWVA